MSGRDKDATWATMGTLCRKLDWSPRRLLQELQNGLPYRTVPPGRVINWHDSNVHRWLNVEASEVSFYESVEREQSYNDPIFFIGPRRVTVGIEVLLSSAAETPVPEPPSPSPRAGGKPTNKQHAGRPPDYPIEIIRQVARDYIKVYGLPRTQTMLREKVRDECERNGFKAPGETRLKQMVDPIHKSESRKKSQSH